MVGIRITESGSYQDSANAYANRYGLGACIYTGLGASRDQSIKKSPNHTK